MPTLKSLELKHIVIKLSMSEKLPMYLFTTYFGLYEEYGNKKQVDNI
jgi:hypothetical protein